MSEHTGRLAAYYSSASQRPALEAIARHFRQALITNNPAELQAWEPDVIVTGASDQLPALRDYCDARHSYLVGLRPGGANPSAPPALEYGSADYLCASDWDVRDFGRMGVQPRMGFLLTGQPWTDPLFTLPRRPLNTRCPTFLLAPASDPASGAASGLHGQLVSRIRAVYPDSPIIFKPHPARQTPDCPAVAQVGSVSRAWLHSWRDVQAADPLVQIIADSQTAVREFFDRADILVSDAPALVLEFMALNRPILVYVNAAHGTGRPTPPEALDLAWRDVGLAFTTPASFSAALRQIFEQHAACHSRRQAERTTELYGRFQDGRSAERAAAAIADLPKVAVAVVGLRDAAHPTLQTLAEQVHNLQMVTCATGLALDAYLAAEGPRHVLLVDAAQGGVIQNAGFLGRAQHLLAHDDTVALAGRVIPVATADDQVAENLADEAIMPGATGERHWLCVDPHLAVIDRERIGRAGGVGRALTSAGGALDLARRLAGLSLRGQAIWNERPLMAYERGIGPPDGEGRWVASEAALTLGYSVCRPGQNAVGLRLTLRRGPAEQYDRFPFAVEIMQNGRPAGRVTFDTISQAHTICLGWDGPVERPQRLVLSSEATFVSGHAGQAGDLPELAVRLAEVRLEPLLADWTTAEPGGSAGAWLAEAEARFIAGDLGGAAEAAQTAVVLAPGAPDVALIYGNLLAQQGDLTRARDIFLDVTRQAPTNALALGNLAGVLVQLGEQAAAEWALSRAVELEPSNALLQQALARVAVGR